MVGCNVKLLPFETTVVEVNDNQRLTIFPPLEAETNQLWEYAIMGLSDALKLEKIKCNDDCGDIPFHEDNGLTLFSVSEFCAFNHDYDFTLNQNKDPLSKVEYEYMIDIPTAQLENFELLQYDEFKIQLQNSELEFIARVGKIGFNYYELVIENDNEKVTIDGIHGPVTYNFNLPSGHHYYRKISISVENEIKKISKPAATQTTSKPIPIAAVSEAPKPESCYDEKLFQDILIQNQYTDVVLNVSGGAKLKSYRCILARFSPILKSIFDGTDNLPVEIDMYHFEANIVLRAISFFYGKDDLVDGFELEMLRFANDYGIAALKRKCRASLESKLTVDNVVDFLNIASKNSFETLKNKCLKMIAENKHEIDREEMKKISPELLLEAMYL